MQVAENDVVARLEGHGQRAVRATGLDLRQLAGVPHLGQLGGILRDLAVGVQRQSIGDLVRLADDELVLLVTVVGDVEGDRARAVRGRAEADLAFSGLSSMPAMWIAPWPDASTCGVASASSPTMRPPIAMISSPRRSVPVILSSSR